jgi:hypothetical protein
MKIPSTLVLLGEPIEIAVDNSAWTFRRGTHALCCNPGGTVLWILPMPRRKKEADKLPSSAASMFELWSGWEADRAYKFPGRTFSSISAGRAESISYRSDKWSGKMTGYIHKFTKRVTVAVNNMSTPTVWRLTGGLKIRAEGITG